MAEMDDHGGRAVPRSRFARAGQFGRLAGGLAGGVMAEGARRLAQGQRPRARELMLTPANLTRVADRLAHLRGAAMKLGQMISLDAGEFLPPELTELLARLRNNAVHMPPRQLETVLTSEWGPNWRRRFRRFQAHAVAAASIGQVHRAELPDGRVVAIKVQYPGVAESIASDVDNVAALLRMSGLLPAGLDIAPLLEAAKESLAREADYVREGQELRRFGERLAGDPDFAVPGLIEEFTTPRVLAMDFLTGSPIEALDEAEQPVRDRAMTALVRLVLRETFEWGAMQTDPNFANYRLLPDGRIGLLDFGAAQAVAPTTAAGYAALLRAALDRDPDAVAEAAVAAGFVGPAVPTSHGPALRRMIDVVLHELHRPGPFDFGDRAFLATLREEGLAIAADRATWHLPPADLLFVQRKISGTALLAARLKAKVPLRDLIAATLEPRA